MTMRESTRLEGLGRGDLPWELTGAVLLME